MDVGGKQWNKNKKIIDSFQWIPVYSNFAGFGFRSRTGHQITEPNPVLDPDPIQNWIRSKSGSDPEPDPIERIQRNYLIFFIPGLRIRVFS